MRHKVHLLNLLTYLNWTPSIEWCVVKCGFKNRHHNNMYPKVIGLHAQNMLINIGSIINIIGGDLYNNLMSIRIFTLTNNQIFIRALKIYRESDYGSYLNLLPCRATCVLCILRDVG